MKAPLRLSCALCALLTLFLSGPGLIGDARAAASSTESKASKTQTGLASFYSRRFDGKRTAGGDTFDNKELVAAHRTYPFGTRARVTNLKNNASVEVVINDRGPSKQNRREGVIIDVSQAAATHLKMKKEGRVKVRVDVLEWGRDDTKR
ncbi:MAG: septal ring lytic transglycosylase RlpA family protein [Pseudomonadota bacterium]